MKKPKGQMPTHVKQFAAANPDVDLVQFICPTCGKWFSTIDSLAPYHMELNYCKRCGYPKIEETHEDALR